MTKKTFLGLSSIINFCIVAFMALTTYLTYNAVNLGKYYPPIVYTLPEIPYTTTVGVFLGVTIFALIAFAAKCAAKKVERNCVTLVCVILDAILLLFFLITARAAFPQLLQGQIVGNITEAVTVLAPALAILFDFFSMPLERWGYTL